MKKYDSDSFMNEEIKKRIKKNEAKKHEKLRELNSIDDYNDNTKGSKIIMYLLLAITFVSVICYFAVTLIYSKNVVEGFRLDNEVIFVLASTRFEPFFASTDVGFKMLYTLNPSV